MDNPIALEQQIAAVEREIGFRKRCYPRWVDGHKMTRAKADHEIAAMEAVLATLQACTSLAPAQASLLAGLDAIAQARLQGHAEQRAACNCTS